jgi:pantoate--beta-alanine ligase
MLIEPTIAATRRESLRAKAAGKTVGFVPTMGALHAGHESLIAAARRECGHVVVSLFVNPTQFGPAEDLGKYPRTFEADAEMCRRNGVDVLFAPTPAEMYPRTTVSWIVPESITETLCGASRPGHFRGVATVVAKLFNIAQPDVAYFGAKDAQQCVVIRRMAADLDFPVQVKVMPTVREPDGLAMSSRNKYLDPESRRSATCLIRALREAERLVSAGERSSAALVRAMTAIIRDTPGTRIDYVSAVDPDTLQPVETLAGPTLLALAVHVGPARLIDNMTVTP